MQIKFSRLRTVTEVGYLEVSDAELRAADIDPETISDADLEEVADIMALFSRVNYDEVEGWEDHDDPQVEIVSYNVGR